MACLQMRKSKLREGDRCAKIVWSSWVLLRVCMRLQLDLCHLDGAFLRSPTHRLQPSVLLLQLIPNMDLEGSFHIQS